MVHVGSLVTYQVHGIQGLAGCGVYSAGCRDSAGIAVGWRIHTGTIGTKEGPPLLYHDRGGAYSYSSVFFMIATARNTGTTRGPQPFRFCFARTHART